MNYAEFYYSQVLGQYPFDSDENKIKTQKVVDYLIEANVSESDIIRVIEESPPKDFLSPEDLPEWLWEGSLLKRNTFYYHNRLHIKTKAPRFNPFTLKEEVDKFYMEMKIKYTLGDLINYFYESLRLNTELADKNKDEGSFRYLLNKYSKLNFIESIDFVLALIDEEKLHSKEFGAASSILDLSARHNEVYEKLKRQTEEAKLHRANRIMWR